MLSPPPWCAPSKEGLVTLGDNPQQSHFALLVQGCDLNSHDSHMHSDDEVSDTLTLCPLTDRTQKLKDARAEAAKEIEALKSSKESEFKKAQKEVSSGRMLSKGSSEMRRVGCGCVGTGRMVRRLAG